MNTSYYFKGITLQGKHTSGVIPAKNKTHAKDQLRDQGIYILYLRKKSRWHLNQPSRITKQQRIIFFYQLSTLLSAGISIIQALKMLQAEEQDNHLQTIIQIIQKQIEAGKPLSSSLASLTNEFNALSCHLIYAGEQSGTLTEMLQLIAMTQEKQLRFRKKIQHALLYPSIITIVAISVTLIMLIFVIPRFVDLFHEFHQTLPAFTRWVLALSVFLQDHCIAICLVFVIASYLFYWLIKNEKYRFTLNKAILHIPWIKHIIIKCVMIRFTQNLATTLNAGIPMADSLTITADTSGHGVFIQDILALQTDITQGLRLYQALQKNKRFPILLTHMVRIGEESGNLPNMLKKTATLYESEIDQVFERLSQLLEPLIMVILGVLIGGLVIAMYLPIFKQGTLI